MREKEDPEILTQRRSEKSQRKTCFLLCIFSADSACDFPILQEKEILTQSQQRKIETGKQKISTRLFYAGSA
jgi:hypothetical protein